MRYARDNGDLDPRWHYCKGCDSSGEFKPDRETGLCPKCAAKKREEEDKP